MADDQPGLRLRMAQEARRISSQHRQLDSLYVLIGSALDRQDPARAREAFLRFKDALDAHMALEDELHFPALHGLHPELEAELTDLAREHRRFRQDLAALEEAFGAEDAQRCFQRIERFVDLFSAHERREERLLRRLNGPPEDPGADEGPPVASAPDA